MSKVENTKTKRPESKPAVEGVLWAEPRLDLSPADCYFYHTIHAPGMGEIKGDWLISDVDRYIGRVNLQEQRVLEIGPASGFLTQAMESRGADVVCFDLGPDYFPDNLISDDTDRTQYRDGARTFQQKMNNGFWFTHQAFNLKAKMVFGSVYNVPKAIGEFDTGTICCVLTHLSNPFAAMAQTLARVKKTAVITEMLPFGTYSIKARLLRALVSRLFPDRNTVPPVPMFFTPHRSVDPHMYTWWQFTPEPIERMLSLLGFRTVRRELHQQVFGGHRTQLFTIVAEREKPGYCSIDMIEKMVDMP